MANSEMYDTVTQTAFGEPLDAAREALEYDVFMSVSSGTLNHLSIFGDEVEIPMVLSITSGFQASQSL